MVKSKRAVSPDEETEEPPSKKINNTENSKDEDVKSPEILQAQSPKKKRDKNKRKEDVDLNNTVDEKGGLNLYESKEIANGEGLELDESQKPKKSKALDDNKELKTIDENKADNEEQIESPRKKKSKKRKDLDLTNGVYEKGRSDLSGDAEEENGEGVQLDEARKAKKRRKSKKLDDVKVEENNDEGNKSESAEKEEKGRSDLSGDAEEETGEGLQLDEARKAKKRRKSKKLDGVKVEENNDEVNKGESAEKEEEMIKITEINIKEFRNCLKHPLHQDRALQEFISVCSNVDIEVDYAKLYLEKGGSCLELIELLGTNVQQVLVIQTLNIIILKIVANMPKHAANAFEACKYVLNTHILTVNRLVEKGSSGKEKTAILKLLASMVLLSDNLAKDILKHVNFNIDNIHALSRQALGGATLAVRHALTNFLISFMINGNDAIISLFLNKHQLATSVVKGFKFDPAENICMYFNIVKKHVLENLSVHKTVKMRVFNTVVVKDIVNLYNWAGPKKSGEVSEIDKSKVSAEVHAFLLTLCASKFGIVFRDYTLGRVRKNVLIEAVLVGLKQPWEHSYASDLVSNICGACPDLVGTIWGNLKPFLEPRNSPQWLKAVWFAMDILEKVQPKCIEYCAKDLDLQQYTHAVKTLACPSEIIKVLKHYPSKFERHWVFQVFEKMLGSALAYKNTARRLFDAKFNDKLDTLLTDYLETHFPPAKEIFHEWNNTPKNCTTEEHLHTVLNILELYNHLCVNLLDSLLDNLDLNKVIAGIKLVVGNNKDLQIRAIKLFTNAEPGLLLPNSKIFEMIIPEILINYHETGVEIAKNSLRNILSNTLLFENCEIEIDLWINSIDNVKNCNESLSEFFIIALKKCNEKAPFYYEQINQLQTELGEAIVTNFTEIIESVATGDSDSTESVIKQNYFSPMILAVFETLRELNSSEKNLKSYINCVILNLFHYQTKRDLFKLLIEKNEDIVDSRLKEYIYSWDQEEIQPLQKFKGKLTVFEDLSSAILNSNQEIDFVEETKHKTDLLQMVIFYLTNLRDIDENIYKTCLFYAKKLSKNNHAQLFKQSLLLKKFSPMTSKENYSTLFVIEMIKFLREENVDLDSHISAYRSKLFKQVLKALRKRKLKNVEKLTGIIDLIKLDYSQCKEILFEITKLNDLFVEDNKTTIIYQICNYALKTFTEICLNESKYVERIGHNTKIIAEGSKKRTRKVSEFVFKETKNTEEFVKIIIKEPLPAETIERLCDCLRELNENKTMLDSSILAKNLREYFQKFPHAYANVSENLFKSILTREENCKENSALAVGILKNRCFLEVLENNIEAACNKKGLILPILDLKMFDDNKKELKQKIYNLLEASVNKVLQKPQKAGQNFENFYTGLCSLIGECMPEKTGLSYVEKVLKFESGEIFHVDLLKAVFEKFCTTEKRVHNSILTMMQILINSFKRAMKNPDEALYEKITQIASKFNDLLKHFAKAGDFTYDQISTNETFKLFCKFCLKFGVGDDNSVIDLLVTVLELVQLEAGAETEFVEMIISHSEFLNVILGPSGVRKAGVLKLFLLVCQKYEKVMCKAHIPFLLGGYSATLSESDQLILQILRRYESVPTQTNFYDFKPILWGTAASIHYSVRSDIQRSLFRQPKISDVLEILQEQLILNTIEHHPLDFTFDSTTIETPHENVYDLRFLLPLFSQILAPENNVPSYLFTKSGGLSMTILGLSHSDKEVRSAAFHVLARFYHHVEGRQYGKDNKLWIRFIEAICRGTAVLKDLQLNNFVSIFFARTALTIIKPFEVMYKPLCRYLGAKVAPRLHSVPELYTFLHSSDVDFKEHTVFILRILKDGLRTVKDMKSFNTAMAYKLIMEIFTSTYSDFEIKSLILEVIKKGCEFDKGASFFCNIYGLLSWLQEIVQTNEDARLLKIILETLLNIITNNPEDLSWVKLILKTLVYEKLSRISNTDIILILLKCVLKVSEVDSDFLDLNLLRVLINFVGCKDCEYMLQFKQVLSVSEDESSHVFYVKHLTRIYLMKCSV